MLNYNRYQPWRQSLPEPRHLAIILVGGGFNLVAVTLGLHGALGLSLLAALTGAAGLSLMQTLIFEEVFENGFWLGLLGGTFYALIVSLNILLAAGGITAALGADILGQSTFRTSIAQPLTDIRAVSSSTNDFAAAMGRVAEHSAEQRAIEVARGGTCTASGAGDGPISRLREDDAAAFGAARETMQQIAAEGQRISTAIDSTVVNYTVSRHNEVVQAISVALGQAHQLARDPRMATIRAALQGRAAQIDTGRPDRLDGSVRVVCPRDTMLRQVIAHALSIPAPQVPANFTAPPVPDEASSVRGLAEALGATLSGGGGDLGPWRLSIMLAPVPDGLFVYGLILHRRRRRGRLTHRERLAEHYGLPSGADPEAAIARALESSAVQALYASHVRHRRLFFRTDFLVVPFSETARRYALLRMDGSVVFDCGIWDGARLPIAAPDIDPSARYQLFGLAKGVWASMEADELRAALSDIEPREPSDPSPQPSPTASEQRAA